MHARRLQLVDGILVITFATSDAIHVQPSPVFYDNDGSVCVAPTREVALIGTSHFVSFKLVSVVEPLTVSTSEEQCFFRYTIL